MDIDIRPLTPTDSEIIEAAFRAIGWDKPAEQYRRYLAEQETGDRLVFVAEEDGVFAGYVTLNLRPDYTPFRAAGVPAIEDLNVLPQFRRRGFATVLVRRAEEAAGAKSDRVGMGVGLSADYGAAQQLYARLGYIPDGRGVAYAGQPVKWGERVAVDDDLVLYLIKHLAG